MITLSYSTIEHCLQPHNSHNWLNKQMGIEVPDNDYFKEGKRLHRITQDHLSGKIIDERLKHIEYVFPLVEETDKDPRCEFFFKVNEKYQVHGFIDADNPEEKIFGELKFSGKMWTLGQFHKSIQRKIYALAKPEYTHCIGITGLLDDSKWENERPKVYRIPLTQRDRDEAVKYINAAIELIEAGEFKGGLNEEGKCTDFRCYFGANCQFK